MKTITKTIEAYEFHELPEQAKQKAIETLSGDYFWLREDLTEYIHEELEAKGFTHDEITTYYSLSYCQGDGLMYETL